jgi:hypothetical protein
VFLPSGTFRVLPPLPEAALCEALRRKVLNFLCGEGALAADLAQRMLGWHHSGFSVHNRIRSKATDAEGQQRLARYMIRCPFALEKTRNDPGSGTVIYRSKLHATLKRNYQLMPALKWLRLLMNHIPDKYEHLVRSRLLFEPLARCQKIGGAGRRHGKPRYQRHVCRQKSNGRRALF